MDSQMRSIPESSSLEQVDQYKQRDMTSSHLFRLGTGLFRNKGKICRHRIIDSAHEVHHNSRSGPVCGYNEATKAASHLHTTGDTGKFNYKKWVSERNLLRSNLNNLGRTDSWLLSKLRTPLETTQLQKYLQKKNKPYMTTNQELMEARLRNERDNNPRLPYMTDSHETEVRNERDDIPDLELHETEDIVDTETNLDECTTDESKENEADKRIHSTLGGRHGDLAETYKQEEIRQFDSLISYCKDHGIILDKSLAEKALLLPGDELKTDIKLTQPGTYLQRRFDNLVDFGSDEISHKGVYKGFGYQYKNLRGHQKAKIVNLVTGICKVEAKVDCWLTFAEYLKLTRKIREAPHFCNRACGLPDDSSFWPGAMLDKLRLWMPYKTCSDKCFSLHSIFHVTFDDFSDNTKDQKLTWPDNERGYVQFGSGTNKHCHL